MADLTSMCNKTCRERIQIWLWKSTFFGKSRVQILFQTAKTWSVFIMKQVKIEATTPSEDLCRRKISRSWIVFCAVTTPARWESIKKQTSRTRLRTSASFSTSLTVKWRFQSPHVATPAGTSPVRSGEVKAGAPSSTRSNQINTKCSKNAFAMLSRGINAFQG